MGLAVTYLQPHAGSRALGVRKNDFADGLKGLFPHNNKRPDQIRAFNEGAPQCVTVVGADAILNRITEIC